MGFFIRLLLLLLLLGFPAEFQSLWLLPLPTLRHSHRNPLASRGIPIGSNFQPPQRREYRFDLHAAATRFVYTDGWPAEKRRRRATVYCSLFAQSRIRELKTEWKSGSIDCVCVVVCFAAAKPHTVHSSGKSLCQGSSVETYRIVSRITRSLLLAAVAVPHQTPCRLRWAIYLRTSIWFDLCSLNRAFVDALNRRNKYLGLFHFPAKTHMAHIHSHSRWVNWAWSAYTCLEISAWKQINNSCGCWRLQIWFNFIAYTRKDRWAEYSCEVDMAGFDWNSFDIKYV